jgi:SOS-response transcriptional repressor LexA
MDNSTALSDQRTLQIYACIRDWLLHKGMSPSLRDIGDECGMSHTSTITHLSRLEGMGWIEREYKIPRSIRLGTNAPDYRPPPNPSLD